MESVKTVVQNELCCGCGTCKAICPTEAISMKIFETGKLQPEITEKCINCGKCLKYCPQVTFNYQSMQSEQFGELCDSPLIGTYRLLVNTYSKDENSLKKSTSGATVTTLVKKLLQDGSYDSAFMVDTYNYSGIVKSIRYTAESDFENVPKSRYVQISHEQDIEYIINNPEERVIFIGTACFVHAVLNVIKKNQLKRENYLLIGLFCDKTMTYHVWDYFDHIFMENSMEKLIFRDKHPAGWPGDVKVFNKAGEEKDISRKERMAVKEYFMPESCLYCMDKLNRFADFSVGDNYTNVARYEKGSNTLFIRTDRAAEIWKRYEADFITTLVTEEEVAKSQKLEARKQNLMYSKMKNIDTLGFEVEKETITSEGQEKYEELIYKANVGKSENYDEIYAQILKNRKKRGLSNMLKQVPQKIVYRIAKYTGILMLYKKLKKSLGKK